MLRALAAGLAVAALALATARPEPVPDGQWDWSEDHYTWTWRWGGALWLWVRGAPWRHYRDEDDDPPRYPPEWGESESDSDTDGRASPEGAWWSFDLGSPAFRAGGRLVCHPAARSRGAWTRWSGGPNPWLAAVRYRRQDALRRSEERAAWRAAACAAAADKQLPLEAQAMIREYLGAPRRACWDSEAEREAGRNRRGRWAHAAALAADLHPGPTKQLLLGHLGLRG